MDYKALVKAVKEHGGLTNAELRDAGRFGADAGWGGFTYYSDTVAFYDANEKLIWDLLEENADSMGNSILELIASFNRAGDVSDVSTFKNLLSWFALEEAGRYLEDSHDREDEEDESSDEDDDEDKE